MSGIEKNRLVLDRTFIVDFLTKTSFLSSPLNAKVKRISLFFSLSIQSVNSNDAETDAFWR